MCIEAGILAIVQAMEAALEASDGREHFPDFVLAELSQRYGSECGDFATDRANSPLAGKRKTSEAF